MIVSIAFSVYSVTDMARSRTFYETVLGFSVNENHQDTWVEYDVGGCTFAITTTDMGHHPGAKGAVVGFEAFLLDECVKRLKEQSVMFVTEVFSTPVCRRAVIEDPDSNRIVIHKHHEG
jgi:predicted enzyme related to lactoylglutathione lyase